MTFHAAIIGGTGVGSRLLHMAGQAIHMPTAFGILRAKAFAIEGRRILLLSRHGARHKVPPHAVNYRAMAAGLTAVGVDACFATAATGSLRQEWGNGTFVACTDFVDVTARNVTLYEREVVHTDFSTPFGPRGFGALTGAAHALGIKLEEGVYVCGNGPRYETPHEIRLYQQIGDVVGMTAATEAIVMREAGIDYSCLAVVTNAAAGISGEELTHDEVVAEMERSGERAVQLLLEAVKRV